MNVVYKGQMVYTNLYLEGYAPITGGRFAMGARTGGLNENLWIDNLSITIGCGRSAGRANHQRPEPAAEPNRQ